MRLFYVTSGRTSYAQIAALFVLFLAFGVSFLISFSAHSQAFYDYQLDKLVHAVAGGALAALFLPYAKERFIIVILATVIGIAFEAAESAIIPLATYGSAAWYVSDTALDVLADAGGAWAAAYPLRKFIYG